MSKEVHIVIFCILFWQYCLKKYTQYIFAYFFGSNVQRSIYSIFLRTFLVVMFEEVCIVHFCVLFWVVAQKVAYLENFADFFGSNIERIIHSRFLQTFLVVAKFKFDQDPTSISSAKFVTQLHTNLSPCMLQYTLLCTYRRTVPTLSTSDHISTQLLRNPDTQYIYLNQRQISAQ